MHELSQLAAESLEDLLETFAEEQTVGGGPLDPTHKRSIGLALVRQGCRKVVCGGCELG